VQIDLGTTSTWLSSELKRVRLPVICIDARHIKTVANHTFVPADVRAKSALPSTPDIHFVRRTSETCHNRTHARDKQHNQFLERLPSRAVGEQHKLKDGALGFVRRNPQPAIMGLND
jgi:hypothetical protein